MNGPLYEVLMNDASIKHELVERKFSLASATSPDGYFFEGLNSEIDDAVLLLAASEIPEL